MASRRSSPQPARRVAVVIEASNAYARGLLSGIRRHVREHEPWTIFLPEHGRGTPPLGPLGEWHGDGVIARIETPAIAAALETLRRRRPLPIVDVSAGRLLADTPYVETDDAAIERWLIGLPKPLALFACYDIRGRQALDACRRAGIAVPDEVAVLGVDDDELLCGLSSPPLSSVIPDAVGAGRLAATLLERLLRGERLEAEEWLLPPLGIATRQSSDVLAIDDPLVVAAVRFIRTRACHGIKVQDVVRELGTSRRILDKRFASRVGHTLHEEITRHRFRRVEQLLVETNLPLAVVAERCGFRHAEYLTVVFTKRYGLPPSRWRALRKP